MRIFVQFPRKDIFSFKCKYCFNILSKAHENICGLKPSPQTIFRSSSAGRLCVMQHCAWTRGHAGTRARDTGPLFSWVCWLADNEPFMAAGGNIVPQEQIFSTDIVFSGEKSWLCLYLTLENGRFVASRVFSGPSNLFAWSRGQYPPCMTLETCCR